MTYDDERSRQAELGAAYRAYDDRMIIISSKYRIKFGKLGKTAEEFDSLVKSRDKEYAEASHILNEDIARVNSIFVKGE